MCKRTPGRICHTWMGVGIDVEGDSGSIFYSLSGRPSGACATPSSAWVHSAQHRFVFGSRMGLAHPIPNRELIIRVSYLLWQVRQIWLRALPPTVRRNVEFVLCGSWQVAHST